LSEADVATVSDGHLSLDTLTRLYIRDHFSYRFTITETAQPRSR
jgi:hypothetical protein